jgi:hypothetical protein
MRYSWAKVIPLFGLMGSLQGGFAWADEIRGPVVTSDGFVLIALERDGDGSDFRHHLAQPSQGFSIHQGLVGFRVQKSGNCHDIFAVVNRGGTEHQTQTRRCPTSDGWHETLVKSDLYDDYEVRWSLHQDGDSTQLQWELKALIPGMAPIILNYHLGEQMSKALGSLGAED